MAIVKLDTIRPETKVGVWEITEPLQFLLEEVNKTGLDTSGCASFKSEIRKAQWAGSRLLLKEILDISPVEVEYDQFGKPHLKGIDAHISISHSRDMVAVIIDSKNSTGIDIEIISPKVKKIEQKFLSNHELEFIDTENEIEHLLSMWGAKEALYKAHGKKKLIFKEQINIQPFSYKVSGNMAAAISLPGEKQDFSLKYEKLGNYMLVYLLNN